jgi:hypothetical protein
LLKKTQVILAYLLLEDSCLSFAYMKTLMKELWSCFIFVFLWSSESCVPKNAFRSNVLINYKAFTTAVVAATAGSSLLTSMPKVTFAQPLIAKECDKQIYKKSIFNIPPKAFNFPESFAGTWQTSFNFEDAKFTDQFTMKELSSDVNVAGFRKYGVAYMPDIGKNFLCDLKYAKQSNLVLEDREFNLKSILSSATEGSVDAMLYDVKRDPNRCSLQYHDSKNSGKQELFTNYRKQEVLPDGTFHTVENIRQSTVRIKIQQRASQTIVDYGLEWNLFMTSATEMSGTMRIISYLQPEDNLYFARPEQPVGIFQYNIKMSKQ